MSKPHERVFAFIGALLFLATSVAVAGLVVWQAHQQRNADQSLSQANGTTNQTEGTTLQGTKLQNFTPIASVPELQVIDIKEGTGETVTEGDTVVAHYTGALASNGIIFQSSHDGPNQPIPFSLKGVIPGWTKGVPGMKVGGTRRLVIPYALAYGEAGQPQGGIPSKADLVFDIELVDIQK